jgi:hypothetical protein
MQVEMVNGVERIELTREELWAMLDREARQFLGMDAHTFVRRYREGKLEDTLAASLLIQLANFAGFAHQRP